MRVDKALRTLIDAAGRLQGQIQSQLQDQLQCQLLGSPAQEDGVEQLEPRTMMSVSPTHLFEMGSLNHPAVQVAAPAPVAVPSALTAQAQGSAAVLLHWKDNDAAANAYNILRSTDGKTYSVITRVIGGALDSYLDTTVAPNRAYWYQVQTVAGNRLSAVSAAVKATTGLAAPGPVVSSFSGVNVVLSWSDPNGTGLGYAVQRSEDGEKFTTIATLKAGATRSYTDATVSGAHTYFYRVMAVSGAQSSSASAAVSVTTPTGAGTVTITPRYGNELIVTSFGADSILISQAASILTIVANGQTFTQMALAAGLFIYDRGGNDTITIDPTVQVRTTITSLGGGTDRITSGASNVSAWIDTTDSYKGSGAVHWIGTLAGNVSKAAGASLANPKDAGSTFKLSESLWGMGPAADDVNQGGVGDCYFLASLAAFAGVNPPVLTESAVDLGDSTFLVRFVKGGQNVYVRVNNDMSTGPYWGYKYARPGANGTMWALVMEKAFAYFRTGVNSYASISGGWMGEVYTGLGVKNASFSLLQTMESAFFSMVSGDLAKGLAVTLGTGSSAPSLVRGHAYTLVAASIDGSGQTFYTVRNPWGVQGDALENSAGYATLTFAQMQANFFAGSQAIA